ncbi:hypothetical protein [Arthrobacter sp. H14]|nr:hypothetical protein [Arthrobacter sp. H14]
MEVSVTYNRRGVTDKDVRKKVSFSAIPVEDLEYSLENLAATVSQA